MYTPAGSNTNAGAPQVHDIGGTLVVSFNTDDDKDALVSHIGGATKNIASNDGGYI